MEANSAGVTKPRTSSGLRRDPRWPTSLAARRASMLAFHHWIGWGILTGGRVCHPPWPLAHVGVEKVQPRGP